VRRRDRLDDEYDNGVGKEVAMSTIVVGYDETQPADRALGRAADLAQAFGSNLIVTSVARVLVGGAVARGIGPIDPADAPELHEEALRHAKAYLAERGLEGEYDVLLGDPATEIVELAERRNADLIVVGTREPGLLKRLLGLSVSGAVQRKAHCDVLIVH
jgi:nucleotide-binding universal stress UspA family protein